VFHDEYARNKSASNVSSIHYSYEVEGKLFIEPNSQTADMFTLTMTNKDNTHNKIFNLSIDSISIYSDKPIPLGGNHCSLTYATAFNQTYHGCIVNQ
jgi:hypothetical protein